MVNLLHILASFSFLLNASGYRILIVSPIPARSHTILGEAMMHQLANAGHEVTFVTGYLPSKDRPDVRVIQIKENAQGALDDEPTINIKSKLDTPSGNEFLNIVPVLLHINKAALLDPGVQKLMNDENEKFDLIIIEWLYTEVLSGLSAVFNCPYIWFSTVEPHLTILELIDQMHNPAYTVSITSVNVPPLSFTQRVRELAVSIFEYLVKIFYVTGVENDIYNELIVPHIRKRGALAKQIPTLEELKYNASLVLSNSHVSMGFSTVLPPNLIPIGGYHVDDTVQPLPQDLQKIMDNAKHGVIYFSMGSNLRSKHFPENLRKQILQVFGELKQTVLWKFEEDLPNRPSNVHILKWAPQQSILAHNNCILFITHGGLLSTTETIHHGVPVIGIPVFADQFVNVARGVQKGFARKVDLSYGMAGELRVAIKEVLTDPKYTIKVKELSRIYHDRAVHPSKDLVHWSEHVIKSGGALHLRSSRLLMPWYQKLYLDLVVVLIVIGISLKYLLRYVVSLLFKKSISESKKFS